MRKITLALAAVFTVLIFSGCSIEFPRLAGPSSSTPVTTTTLTPLEQGWTPPPSVSGVSGTKGLPDIADVVPLITPFVVSIQTEAITYDVFLRPYPEQGAGTGIIIDSNGYILTNNHVVEGATKVTVNLADGRAFDATNVRTDPQTDIAVIKINATGLPAAKIGDSNKLRVGDWVIAVGNALALDGGPTVTKGIVSYLGRSIQEDSGATLYDLIQTDAAINPGNSGGPLVNLAGEVVGINTAMVGSAQNIGFAISITPTMPTVTALINIGYVARTYLGISMQTVTSAVARQYRLGVQTGVLVYSVSRGSPAVTAGMKAGDVIVTFGGQDVRTEEALRKAITNHKPGDDVEIVLYRGSSQMTIHAILSQSGPTQ